jgi:hypothetical protein
MGKGIPETTDALENEEGIELLLRALKKLNLIPITGFGSIEITFQDGMLIDTIKTTVRTRIKVKM